MVIINPYSFILDDFVWSFSRLQTYERCPYAFYLQYIKKVDQSQNAFAEYGTFCHELLEKYFKGELMVFELLSEYEKGYVQNIIHDFPPNQYVDLAERYYLNGYNYFANFDGLPQYKVLEVEKEVHFTIDKYKFLGYIDLVVQNKNDEIEVIDHKSKDLSKPQKSKWNDLTTRRESELYHYLRQLYIYSIPIVEQEGLKPKYLNFNCFRKGKWIQVPFDERDYEESKQWALNIINQIYADENMIKTYENEFFCDFLCSVKEFCPKSNRYLGGIA